MIYPSISDAHYNELPEPFKAMIDHDNNQPAYQPVVYMHKFESRLRELREWSRMKNEIRKGCIQHIKKQGGNM